MIRTHSHSLFILFRRLFQSANRIHPTVGYRRRVVSFGPMRPEWNSAEISHIFSAILPSQNAETAAGLTNSINSSRKLKVTWLILGRSHTRSSFQLQPPIFWHRKPIAWGKVRIESDARSTMCPGQNDIHFLFTVGHWVVTGGYVFISVSSFVCLLASRIIQKLLHRFTQSSVERQHMDQWRND